MYNPEKKKGSYIAIGFLVGFVLASRYSDVLLFVLPLLFVFTFELVNRRFSLSNWILFSIPVVVWVVIVIAYHQGILGGIFNTPYDTHFRDLNGVRTLDAKGYFPEKILVSLYQAFINPNYMDSPEYVEGFPPALYSIPYVVFGFTGIAVVWRRYPHARFGGLVLGISGIVLYLMYAAFWGVQGSELKYYCLRYFVFAFPVFAVLSMAGVVTLISEPQKALSSRPIFTSLVVASLLVLAVYFFPKANEFVLRLGVVDAKKITVTASAGATGLGELLDNDHTTRFTTNAHRAGGQFVELDFADAIALSEVRMNSAHNATDRSTQLEFFSTADGKILNKLEIQRVWFTGQDWFFSFNRTEIKGLRIVSQDSSDKYWWSISDLYVK